MKRSQALEFRIIWIFGKAPVAGVFSFTGNGLESTSIAIARDASNVLGKPRLSWGELQVAGLVRSIAK